MKSAVRAQQPFHRTFSLLAFTDEPECLFSCLIIFHRIGNAYYLFFLFSSSSQCLEHYGMLSIIFFSIPWPNSLGPSRQVWANGGRFITLSNVSEKYLNCDA